MSFLEYPKVEKYLDKSSGLVNTAKKQRVGDDLYLIVTQIGEFEGGQILFKWDGITWQPVSADTVVDAEHSFTTEAAAKVRRVCTASSDEDHATFSAYVRGQVNIFSSADGPDNGNLACVWTVRHLAFNALNRWITKTDGTAVFAPEMNQGYGQTFAEGDVKAGGIIISPTIEKPDGSRNIGHVGVLGGGHGDTHLIYSNSSAHKRLEQNFNLGTWKARYSEAKGLKVLYFPLPLYE